MAKKSLKVKSFTLLLAVFSLIVYLYVNACNYVYEVGAESFYSSMSTQAYSAAYSTITKDDLEDIYCVKTDSSGKVTFISTDAFKANKLAILIAKNTYDCYVRSVSCGVDVPIGAFFGIRLLSGAGENVKVNIVKVSSVKCSFVSSMTTAGINQTRQRLYLIIEPQIRIIVGATKRSISEKVEILLVDNLIVGEVPKVYLAPQTVAIGDYAPISRPFFM